MVVGYLPSSFDLLNVRDLDLISQAAARCERLVLGVLSDEMVEALTGRRPVVPLAERLLLVSHVRGVHQTVPHDLSRFMELGADTVVFAAADEVAPWSSEAVVTLTPRRDTQSAILRNALRPTEREAVA